MAKKADRAIRPTDTPAENFWIFTRSSGLATDWWARRSSSEVTIEQVKVALQRLASRHLTPDETFLATFQRSRSPLHVRKEAGHRTVFSVGDDPVFVAALFRAIEWQDAQVGLPTD